MRPATGTKLTIRRLDERRRIVCVGASWLALRRAPATTNAPQPVRVSNRQSTASAWRNCTTAGASQPTS